MLTGFEPFGGARLNASWEAVRLVAQDPPDGVRLSVAELPCVFGGALDALWAAIVRADPDVVICVGQMSSRGEVSLERVAINVRDTSFPDNAGNRPVDSPIEPGGPAAYFTGLPIKACEAAIRAAGLSAEVSDTAGTYVCNDVFYGLMHLIATRRPRVRGGFVHVPLMPVQAPAGDRPTMPLRSAAAALRLVVSTTVATRTDARDATGSTP